MCVCVERGATSFDWTHSCFDIDGPGRGEEDRLPQRTIEMERGREEEEGGNCQRLRSSLKRGLERAEGTVSPLEVVSALVTLSGIAWSCGQLFSFRMRSHHGLCSTDAHLDVVTWINSQTSEPMAPACCDVKK